MGFGLSFDKFEYKYKKNEIEYSATRTSEDLLVISHKVSFPQIIEYNVEKVSKVLCEKIMNSYQKLGYEKVQSRYLRVDEGELFTIEKNNQLYSFVFIFHKSRIEVKVKVYTVASNLFGSIKRKPALSFKPSQVGEITAVLNTFKEVFESITVNMMPKSSKRLEKNPPPVPSPNKNEKSDKTTIGVSSVRIVKSFDFDTSFEHLLDTEMETACLSHLKDSLADDKGFESFEYDQALWSGSSLNYILVKNTVGFSISINNDESKNTVTYDFHLLEINDKGNFVFSEKLEEKKDYVDEIIEAVNYSFKKINEDFKEGLFSKALSDINIKNTLSYCAKLRSLDELDRNRVGTLLNVSSVEMGFSVIQRSIFLYGDGEAQKQLNKVLEQYSSIRNNALKDLSGTEINPNLGEINEILDDFTELKESIKVNSSTLATIKISKFSSASGKKNKSKFIGQENAKNTLDEIISNALLNKEKEKRGMDITSVSFHSAFIGNPGTGKTTFARYFSEKVKEVGFLSKGHFIECSRTDLVAGYVGQTAMKTKELFEKALGGILFIDEAYSLYDESGSHNFGQEAIDTLIKLMEDHKNDIIVIFAGYEEEMREFLNSNPGLKSRVPNQIMFEDFSSSELKEIFNMFLENSNYLMKPEDIDFSVEQILKEKRGKSFGNGRVVRNIFERIVKQQNARIAKQDISKLSDNKLKAIIYSDVTPEVDDEGCRQTVNNTETTVEENPLEQLTSLVGLDRIKESVQELSDFIEIEKMRNPGDLNLSIGLHMAFLGRPGKGKTTVARIVGNIFKNLDILPSGHVVEVDRSDLVGAFIGETAIKTKDKIDKAIGGILFVDEAYSLAKSSGGGAEDFGKEAIETILKYMEDYRDKLVVIFAGYDNEMNTFFKSNPGLQSRIPNILNFVDYTPEELFSMTINMLSELKLIASTDTIKEIVSSVYSSKETDSYANGRTLRNKIDQIMKSQAKRLISLKKKGELQPEMLNKIIVKDLA
ncbi:AAA family ATPase [Bacteriovoracaceae bacterium]|nr:AAA family ATPase [Bacteriovoracaceae bacterium]